MRVAPASALRWGQSAQVRDLRSRKSRAQKQATPRHMVVTSFSLLINSQRARKVDLTVGQQKSPSRQVLHRRLNVPRSRSALARQLSPWMVYRPPPKATPELRPFCPSCDAGFPPGDASPEPVEVGMSFCPAGIKTPSLPTPQAQRGSEQPA